MKMIKNIIQILTVSLVLMFISGCNKFLEIKPQSEITNVTFWKTANDYKLSANWFYLNSLDDPHYYGTNNNDNMSDIAIDVEPDAISSGTYVAPEQDGVWDGSYTGIRNANKLIEQGEKSSIKNDILPYLGEGYFFRAYNYFNLLKSYGGVPLIDKVLDPSSSEIYNERA